ncbi:WcbI family polysaccharide biosynthesis putative acetyltransferase [Pseudoalteromonas agarivorans]|uniref:WcbI family polysaccharide biosynthesis putative acetyltransferase n=1 Tax=Pseudoalteromonas agarivorans TaxID=176102 RepID=UPI00311DD903
MAKKKVVVIANCQARPINIILEAMCDDIEITKVGIIHLLKSAQENEFTSYFEDADYIIAQIVQPTYPCEFVRTDYLQKRYGKKIISIVNLYYNGDTPYLNNLPKEYRLKDAPFSDYHFQVVFDNWFKGESVSTAAKALKAQYSSKNDSVPRDSVLELKHREKDADIKISDFLEPNSSQRGFHTFNHPTNYVLIEYCARILAFLGLNYTKEIILKDEILDQIVPFEDEDTHKIIIKGVAHRYTTLELVSLFFYFYNSLEGIKVGKIAVPKVIVQYWDGDNIPPDVLSLMDSWKKCNPDYQYKIYNFQAAYDFILKNYGVEEAKIFNNAKLPAMQSDIFRVAFCLKNGGTYVDAATKCLASIDDLIKESGSLTVMRKWHGGIWNGFISANSGDNTLVKIWNAIVVNVSEEIHDNVLEATGPSLFNKFCNSENATIIEQTGAKPYFDLVNDLSHKGDTHWSKVQQKQSIYNSLRTITKLSNADKIARFFETLPEDVKASILQDLPRWINKTNYKEDKAFQYFWEGRQEFRSVIKYRIMMAQEKFELDTNILHEVVKLAGNTPTLFVSNLYLSCKDIGPGLYIEHGFSTIVFAKSIGKNFWVNQSVTIGTGKDGYPTIGDDVRIGANSVVIGGFKVNDRVKVGAGAVLNFEVPVGSTVVAQKPRVLPEAP